MKPTGYQIFLMVELARLANIIEPNLEYDTTWEMGEKLYSEFQNSKFDDPNEPEYECIEKFLFNYNKEAFEAFLLTCEKVQDDITDEQVDEYLEKGFCSLRLKGGYYWVNTKLYTITNDGKLILNIGNGKTKILSEW